MNRRNFFGLLFSAVFGKFYKKPNVLPPFYKKESLRLLASKFVFKQYGLNIKPTGMGKTIIFDRPRRYF